MQNEKILQDENQKVQFDFSNSLNVFEPHELANMYSEYLSDVDFVVEGNERLFCVEYKNANIEGAENPQALTDKLNTEAFWKKIAKKFYGTMFLVWACNQNPQDKPVQYILLIETNPCIDAVIKKRFMLKMQSRLPFKYKENEQIKRHVIDYDFLIMDINEWNEKFPAYPVEQIKNKVEQL